MRLNKVAGIAASTFFTGALVLGMATTASAAPDLGSLGSAAPSCDVQVTAANTQGWTGIDAKATPGFTADGLEFKNQADDDVTHVEFYKPADGPLSEVAGEDFSYTFKITEGANVPALQVRVIGATTSKWPVADDKPGNTGFATLVWSPSAAQIAKAADGLVTITGEELETSANWWMTGTDTTQRTFAEIVTANPNAKVEHVGLTMTLGDPAVAVVSEFTYKDCVSTFSAPAVSAGSLGSLGGFGNLGGILANFAG